MNAFPRTMVGGVSLSRMVIGTNWFLGFSHTTPSKDAYINENVGNTKAIADILEVFFRAGVDTIMGPTLKSVLTDGIKEAEDRTGKGAIFISTPIFPVDEHTPHRGLDLSACAEHLDNALEWGAKFCLPHQFTTDSLADRCTRKIRHMEVLCQMIRERGMIPGLSTHMPEVIQFADESGLDVETYIAIYNTMGFLMQIEVDWVNRIIHQAKKPVLTIKPLAAGQVRPLQGLTFVWNTIREQDLVTVGTMSPHEAAEVVEMSLDILDRRASTTALQRTRSKAVFAG